MKSFYAHLIKLGFTNRLAVYIIILVALDLIGGFYLANKSIDNAYLGALACWTVVSTPIGTCATLVLNKIVIKSDHENSDNGKGIKYAAAEAKGFDASPPI